MFCLSLCLFCLSDHNEEGEEEDGGDEEAAGGEEEVGFGKECQWSPMPA